MPTDSKPALTPKLRFSEFRNALAWETKTLGSLVTINTEKVGDNECVPMSITSGVGLVSQMEKFGRVIAGSSYKNYLLLRKNDFAYNKSATKEYPEGFIALYSDEALAAVPNSIFTCFRINGDSPLPEYLNYLFFGNLHGRWLRKFIEVGARAHGSLSIDEDDLLALPVPLPEGKTTRAEQQKIAECLSTLDELIGAESQKLDALKAHKKGLMQQLFPREGETLPRLRFPEFRSSPNWDVPTIQQLIDKRYIVGHLDGNHGELYPRSEEFSASGIPYISANDFADGFVHFDRCRFLPQERALQFRKGVAKDGDVLFAHNATVGPVAKLSTRLMFVILSTTATYFRCDQNLLSNDFLKAALTSPAFVSQYTRVMAQSTRNQVPITTQRRLTLQIPKLAEQHRIANCLSSLSDLIAAQSDRLCALQTHKQGLLQQLFPSPSEANV